MKATTRKKEAARIAGDIYFAQAVKSAFENQLVRTVMDQYTCDEITAVLALHFHLSDKGVKPI